jgi:hypothetical protein
MLLLAFVAQRYVTVETFTHSPLFLILLGAFHIIILVVWHGAELAKGIRNGYILGI